MRSVYKRITCLVLALCLLLLLCGCELVSGSKDETVSVYRVNLKPGGSQLVREEVSVGNAENYIDAAVAAINSKPRSQELGSAFPESVMIEDLSIENGVATVHMSPRYLILKGRDKLVADSALVLSLGTLDEVFSVDIAFMETVLQTGLVPESYLEADNRCADYECSLKLYIPDGENEQLRPLTVQTTVQRGRSLVETVVTELFALIGGGVEETRFISTGISDGVCRVELSQEFYGREPADRARGELVIYSVVNSLCRIPGIDAVTITVEGTDVDSYGDYSTLWPLEADMSLVSFQEN